MPHDLSSHAFFLNLAILFFRWTTRIECISYSPGMAGCLEIDTRICRASCVIYYSSSTSMGLLAWLAKPIIVIAPPRKIITFAIIWIFAHTEDCLYIINTSKPALAMMSTVYAYPLPHTTQSIKSPQKLFVVLVLKTRASYSALKTEFLPIDTSKSSTRPIRQSRSLRNFECALFQRW